MPFDKLKLISRLKTAGFLAAMAVVVWWFYYNDLDAHSEAASPPQRSTASPWLKQVATIDLPGPPGKRFDYLTIDPDDHWLLSAHLAAGLLYVIDLRTNQVVKAIPDVPGVEGVEYVPEGRKVYTSDWQENKIGVVSLSEMRVIKKLPTESKPDGSTYAAPFHKLYVSDERGKAEAVIDTQRDEIIKTLHFDSETGMPQYDPIAKRVWLNLQDQNILAEIDPANDTVVGRYPVGRCEGNHGMALDAEHRRAFLVCEGNDLLTVFDLAAHKPLAFFSIAAGGDVVKFDPGLQRVYVACSSGAISIIQEDDAAHFRKLADFPVQPKVHSLAIDPATHRVYAPEQEEDGKPVARMVVFEASGAKVAGAQPAAATPTVVFVCEHGAAKSVIAAAYFNKLAAERRLNVRAIARGVEPQAELAASAVAGLEHDGVSFSREKPSRLSPQDAHDAIRVVAFSALPATIPQDKRFAAFDVPAPGDGYSAARDAILLHVARLVDELQKGK